MRVRRRATHPISLVFYSFLFFRLRLLSHILIGYCDRKCSDNDIWTSLIVLYFRKEKYNIYSILTQLETSRFDQSRRNRIDTLLYLRWTTMKFYEKGQMLIWLIKAWRCVTYLAHMYSNNVIVAFVVSAICVRMLVDEMTVNDDALLSFSCPLLLLLLPSCYVLVHWSCACEWIEKETERERESKSRVANRRSEGQASTHQRKRERVERTGHHKDRKNAKKCITINGRLFDALVLAVVRTLVRDDHDDDVLLLLSLRYISRSLSIAHYATSGLSGHTALLTLLPLRRSFSLFSLSLFATKTTSNDNTIKKTTTCFPFYYSALQIYLTSVRIVLDRHIYISMSFILHWHVCIPVVLIIFLSKVLTYERKKLKVKNDLMHSSIIIYLYFFLNEKRLLIIKKSVDASTAITTMMKEKSYSFFPTHFFDRPCCPI